MTINIEKEILDFISELLSLEHLKDILEKVVSEAPRIIDCEGCGVYLIPELIKESQDDLIEHSGTPVYRHAVRGPFIILAAHSHSREKSDYKLGQHFYRSGEGLTGWVFENEAPLFLDDLSDPEERRKYPGLIWKNKYGHAKKWYSMEIKEAPKPFIALPLIAGRHCVGVIRFMNTKGGKAFTELAKETVRSFGKLIARRIETDLSNQDKQRSIKNLITIGAMSNEPGVFKAIVEESKKTVRASACRLYILDEIGEKITLVEHTDEFEHSTIKTAFRLGEGYIGWIFKTGFPLRLNEIEPRIRLHHFNIETYTGSNDFFDEYRNREHEECIDLTDHELSPDNSTYTRFLGVPLSKGKGRIHGVLSALSCPGSKTFDDEDLYLLNKLAQTVTLLLESLRQQKLNELLIRMGHEYGDKLFQYVVQELPALVVAQGCSFFNKSDSNNGFTLKYTSSQLLKDKDGKVLHICYTPGVGKTGFVAKHGRILMINHYGLGEMDGEGIDRRRLEADFNTYTFHKDYADINLVKKINNEAGQAQGLARMIRDKNDPPFTFEERKAFEDFIDLHPYVSKAGLECHEHNKLCEDGTDGGYSTSFLGVPFRDRQGNVYGVMRIPKSSPGGEFNDQDISLVVSVCNRLFSYIQLEQNLLTITRINTQINTSFGDGNLNSILNSILVAVTDTLGFEFVTIQLVSPDKKTIRQALNRKNPRIADALDPERWRVNVNFRLDADPPDIQVWLVREHKKPVIVKGWHEFFNSEIYNEHHHENLIRAFIPIINQNTDEIIGTIEAGHHIKRKDFIDDQEINMLKALADSAAIAIKNTQLHEDLKAKIEESKRAYSELVKVSHELGRPLTPIKQYMESTLEGVYGDISQDLRIRTATNLRLLNDEIRQVVNIRDLTNIRENMVHLEFSIVDLSQVIGSVIQLLEVEAKNKNTKIIEEYRIQQLKANVDELRIKSVLINLIHNAIRHTQDGSEIRIAGHAHDNQVTISIIDNGPGIPLDQQEMIRQHSYHIGKKPGGMGIGLAIAKEIVEMHGGTLDLKSSMGEGCQFSITLPDRIEE